jgi:hypothetical protein
MDISIRLLGQVNTQANADVTVPQRHIAVVTAEALSGWLSYEPQLRVEGWAEGSVRLLVGDEPQPSGDEVE